MKGNPLSPDPEQEDLPPGVVEYLACQDATPPHTLEAPAPAPPLLVVLASLVHHASIQPGRRPPTLAELADGWTGFPHEDLHALQRLHSHRILTVSADSPREAFIVDAGHVVSIRARHARYHLTGHLDAGRRILDHMTQAVCAATPVAARRREELAGLVIDIEIRALAAYTDALLGWNGQPTLPDDVRGPYADRLREGLTGHTFGQLIWLIGRSAGHDPTPKGIVAAYAKRLQAARKGRVAIPEQDLPFAVGAPAALPHARILLRRVQATLASEKNSDIVADNAKVPPKHA